MQKQLINSKNGDRYPINNPIWIGEDNGLLNLSEWVNFEPSNIIGNNCGLWRYRNFIALEKDRNIVTLGEGYTPLVEMKFSNGIHAQIKLDHLFPTGSYKDRGASVLISKIKELGINSIVQDSSGNAGASVAAYSAKANISCAIFLPEDTSQEKILQMEAYGAKINRVKGNRKETAKMAYQAAIKSYYASHCVNPFFFEGTKTFAYEICEQRNWKQPEAVILPAGNGTLILGCFIGFNDLLRNGVISKMPKIIAVQSENCQPLAQLNQNPNFILDEYLPTDTLAEGIAIPNPIRAHEMLDAITKTNGMIITVSEKEIKNAWKELAQMGHYIEPTSAATIAGIFRYGELGNSSEGLVSLISGTGLKSSAKISKLME